jgi:hypothetical protein
MSRERDEMLAASKQRVNETGAVFRAAKARLAFTKAAASKFTNPELLNAHDDWDQAATAFSHALIAYSDLLLGTK